MSSGAAGAVRILDRYVMHAEIASGGMASVHLGQVRGAAGFARPVAIKRLHPQFAKDPEFSSMFLDEAHLAARISHPNVISVIDVVAGDGELFLVMEYVAGESLANLLRQAKSAPPPAVAVAIVAGALAGLHAAHEAKSDAGEPLHIVHRDVSPQNLLVGRDGAARVLDFGLAHAAVRSHATREGQVKGKLRYMAPEQLRGEVATRRSDVYAAAVVLWETLTGEKLFAADTDIAQYGKILESVIQPPSRFVEVPRALDEVVLRGLSRDRDRRFATAIEMAHALESAMAPASPREVGVWVERVAGRELAVRAAKLQDIEAGAPAKRSLPAPPPDALPREPGENTAPALAAALSMRPRDAGTATHTDVAASARGRRGGATRWIVIATLVGSIAGGVVALRARPSAAVSPQARRGVGAAGLLAALAIDRDRARAAVVEAAKASTVPDDPTSEPRPEATSTALEPRRARGIPTTTRSRCDPPYIVDAAGIRRVKRECL